MTRPDAKVEKIYLYPSEVSKIHRRPGHLARVEYQIDRVRCRAFCFSKSPPEPGETLYWERNSFCLWLWRLESKRFKTSPDVRPRTYRLKSQAPANDLFFFIFAGSGSGEAYPDPHPPNARLLCIVGNCRAPVATYSECRRYKRAD